MLNEQSVYLIKEDSKNRTILHCTAISGLLTEESLSYLFHVFRVQMNARNAFGKTALQHTAEMVSEDHHHKSLNVLLGTEL
jgi:hypothetical protein